MTTNTTRTSKTFRIFLVTNDESRQTTNTTKQTLLLTFYAKDSNPDAHVKVFKVAIKINGETNDANIINFFSFTL
jgi:hypothetical protein